jgi:hypothetical protein
MGIRAWPLNLHTLHVEFVGSESFSVVTGTSKLSRTHTVFWSTFGIVVLVCDYCLTVGKNCQPAEKKANSSHHLVLIVIVLMHISQIKHDS